MLLIHGAKDWQVQPNQSQAMNVALKKYKKDVRLVMIKGATHELERQSELPRQILESGLAVGRDAVRDAEIRHEAEHAGDLEAAQQEIERGAVGVELLLRVRHGRAWLLLGGMDVVLRGSDAEGRAAGRDYGPRGSARRSQSVVSDGAGRARRGWSAGRR